MVYDSMSSVLVHLKYPPTTYLSTHHSQLLSLWKRNGMIMVTWTLMLGGRYNIHVDRQTDRQTDVR